MAIELSFEPELCSLETKLSNAILNDKNQRDVLDKRIKTNEALLEAVRTGLGKANGSKGMSGYGSKSEIVRNAIQQLPKSKFTQADVEVEIRRTNSTIQMDRKHIRTALWTLAKKRGFIRQVTKGNNQQPAEFEKSVTATNGASGTKEAHRLAYGTATSTGVITVGDLETYVTARNRRMKHLTAHFEVDEATIRRFIEPNSKVYEATRGWFKVRE